MRKFFISSSLCIREFLDNKEGDDSSELRLIQHNSSPSIRSGYANTRKKHRRKDVWIKLTIVDDDLLKT